MGHKRISYAESYELPKTRGVFKKIYKYPAIVVDFGTATTFDIIDNKGNYDGGLITPGINLSLETLYKKTSKLPLVNLKKKKRNYW